MLNISRLLISTFFAIGIYHTANTSPASGSQNGYKISNFKQDGSNYTKDLDMGCINKVSLYISTNKNRTSTVEECSAFVARDSYYKEYLLPKSLFKNLVTNNKINVCSAGKAIFEVGVSPDWSSTKFDKCQILIIRTQDRQYIYAGYITPTIRIH
jgi:hypothetical protein